jgi:UDP-2,3-diacylglucosamine hydrolase
MTAPPASRERGPLAMICGGGSMPVAVAQSVKARGRDVVLFPLRGAAEGLAVEQFPHHWLHIGQIGKFTRMARAAGCHDVVFIGSLVRPSLWRVRPDLKGLQIMPRVIAAYRGGDDHLLSGMARLFEQDGFHLLGAHEVAPEILVPEGRLGRVAPSPRDRDDFDIGFACLRAIGPFDIGQAVVVSGKHVLAVEAAEGTDLMLARVAELRANGRVPTASDKGVLVKAAKATQDRRFDLPSIGPKTVEGIVRAGLGGIAVIAGETIIAEPPGVVAAADGANVFVVGIRSGTPA